MTETCSGMAKTEEGDILSGHVGSPNAACGELMTSHTRNLDICCYAFSIGVVSPKFLTSKVPTDNPKIEDTQAW